ncbi:MAG: GYD domain-containing protein, partial [Pseudolabrys sp.]
STVSAADPNSSVAVPMSALDQKQTLAMIGPWANRAVDSEKCFFNRKPTRECKIMPTYISLVQFTDQGIRAAKDTTHRLADWAAKVKSRGVTVKQMYWTLGQYDQVCVLEAPDDETAAAVLLAADMLGNIRTQTLRAFTVPEMEKILATVP